MQISEPTKHCVTCLTPLGEMNDMTTRLHYPSLKAEEVRHIHLSNAENLWPPQKLQFNKTSDSHLIYCQGSTDSNNYLLMGILAPDAHKQARDNNIMFKLGKMAEHFRRRY